MSKRNNEAGDTLVEVLIAIAIISSVLTGAFAVSQRSAIAVRNSQEQSEMLQIIQGQVELVRSLALQESNDNGGVYAAQYFCVDTRPGTNQYKRVTQFPTLPALETDPFDAYDPACANIQGHYYVAARYDPTPNVKTFTFYGRWDGLSGNKKQEILTYRVYPGK